MINMIKRCHALRVSLRSGIFFKDSNINIRTYVRLSTPSPCERMNVASSLLPEFLRRLGAVLISRKIVATYDVTRSFIIYKRRQHKEERRSASSCETIFTDTIIGWHENISSWWWLKRRFSVSRTGLGHERESSRDDTYSANGNDKVRYRYEEILTCRACLHINDDTTCVLQLCVRGTKRASPVRIVNISSPRRMQGTSRDCHRIDYQGDLTIRLDFPWIEL